jgi:hypothetical protein
VTVKITIADLIRLKEKRSSAGKTGGGGVLNEWREPRCERQRHMSQ